MMAAGGEKSSKQTCEGSSVVRPKLSGISRGICEVLKSSSARRIATFVAGPHTGGKFSLLPIKYTVILLGMITSELLDSLTDEEILVLNQVVRHRKTQDISRNLQILKPDIKRHVSSICIKAGLPGTTKRHLILAWKDALRRHKYKFTGYEE